MSLYPSSLCLMKHFGFQLFFYNVWTLCIIILKHLVENLILYKFVI